MDDYLVRDAAFLESEPPEDTYTLAEHQIFLVVGGEADISLPDKTLRVRKGDLVLLGSGESCRFHILKAPFRRYSLSIDPQTATRQLNDETLLHMLTHHPNDFSHSIRVKDLDNFIRIFGNLISEYKTRYCKPYTQELQLLLVKQLLIRAFRTRNRTAVIVSDFPMRDRVFTVQYYIDSHYQTDLRINRLCEDMHINPSHFSRMFKAYVGMSPKQYLTHRRLEQTQNALLTTNHSVSAIALENGFVDVNNFTRLFRKTYGVTPSQYREKANG